MAESTPKSPSRLGTGNRIPRRSIYYKFPTISHFMLRYIQLHPTWYERVRAFGGLCGSPARNEKGGVTTKAQGGRGKVYTPQRTDMYRGEENEGQERNMEPEGQGRNG